MRKGIFIFIITTLLLSMVITEPLSNRTYANEENVISLGEDSLVDWLIDKENNTINAVTANGNLHYISLDSFEIMDTVHIGKNPMDIDLQDDQLYISLPDFSQIRVVDRESKEIKEHTTLNNPDQISVGSDKVFYTNGGRLYHYNFATNSEEEVTIQGETYSSFSNPVLHLEDETNTLLIAESGSSGSNMKAISTIDYSLITKTTFNEEYGFSYPKKNLAVDGQDIFYAGHKINLTNLEDIYGVYAEDYRSEHNKFTAANIVAVDENYVFSTKSIYDRDTFKKVGSFAAEVSHILPDGERKYVYNASDHAISINMDTYSDPTVEVHVKNNKLNLNQQIDDWVVDETNSRIYAISESSNELIFIDTETMNVVERKIIGAIPTDIELVDGKLYIALFGGTKIAVTEPVLGSEVTYITTKQNPFEIETDGTDLYYTTEDQWVKIYHIDLITNTERTIEKPNTNSDTYYEPSIKLDSRNDLLYIAESGSSGSDLYVMDPVDGSHVSESDYKDGYGFSYPARKVFLDEDYVYYAGFRLQKNDVTLEQGSYFDRGEAFVSLQGDYVISTTNIYDKETLLPVYTLPSDLEINLANINSNGEILLSVIGDNAIYKFQSLEDLQQPIVKNLEMGLNAEGKYQFDWDMMTGDGYNIYTKSSDTESMSLLNTAPLLDQSYIVTDSQLLSWYGNTVTFGVKSLFGNSESSSMNTIDYTFEIPIPENLQSQFEEGKEDWKGEYGNRFFTVSWDQIDLVDGYNLYYYTEADKEKKKVSEILADDPNVFFTEHSLESFAGKTVYFEVTAVANGKESDLSETISYTFEENTNTDLDEEEVSEQQQEKGSDQQQEQKEDGKDNQQSPQRSESSSNGNSTTGTANNEQDRKSENESQTGDPTSTNQEEKEDKGQVFVRHSKQGNTIVFSEDEFINLENESEVVVDLKDDDDEDSEVLFTKHHISILQTTNSSISIEKPTTSITIPSFIFDGNADETSVSLRKQDPVSGAISDVYDFTITQGTNILSQFSEPVLLSFRVDPSKVENPDNVKIYYYNEEDEAWELIGGIYEDGVVTAETDHFSIFTVFEMEETASSSEEDTSDEELEESDSLAEDSEVNGEKDDTSSSSALIWISLIVIVVAGSIFFYVRKIKQS
ncbi:hypothetical protein ACFSTA_09085 [Ornithinibacillus salinisoli]|uniref:Fibronectin type-III domain-containing protein n=1 Tax=Ornithinibacillus salinisoli TaxID=1848459 RepID=A0ABW4VZ39_9BACI